MSDEEDEPLDPRIQHELERLNKASLLINKLENDLDDARGKFRSLLTESTQKLESLCRRLGSCIDKSKPYYDARLRAKEIQVLTHQAATKYERAMSMQTAAREMVELAEQGYQSKKPTFDTAWQEMLNHATMKVMDAENERMLSEAEHQRTAQRYAEVQEEVNLQYKENKRNISKSKAYYEMKANFHTSLETQKAAIEKLQNDVNSSKKLYAKALSNLEAISQEIHDNRQQKQARKELGKREQGVGSESPIPPPVDRKEIEAKLKLDSEIIISFPPAASSSQQTKSKNSPGKTTNSPKPTIAGPQSTKDNIDHLDISGIKIDITPAASGHSAKNNEDIEGTQSGPNSKRHSGGSTGYASGISCSPSSSTTSPVAMRHKRMLSGSFQLSAKRLLHETSSIDSDSGSVNSFVVLDDEGVVRAMSGQYFDGSFEEELRKSTHEDYSYLPQSLSHYQKGYETARRSVSFPPLEEAELKLDQVLKLLDDSEGEESVV